MAGTNSKILLTTLGILAAAGVLMFLVVMPQLQRVRGLRADMASNRQELARLQSEIAAYEAAKEELQKVAAQAQALALLFPAREEMAAAVEAMEAAIGRAGVESALDITDYLEQEIVQPKSAAKKQALLLPELQAVEEVPITLELRDNFGSLGNFFQYLEHEQVLIRFRTLSAVAEKDTGDQTAEEPRNTGMATAKMDGVLFMKKN